MSIPKEPRQLMINLMYLVLTAMLALNVSAEIINMFFTLDNGLAKNNQIIDLANQNIITGMESTADTKIQYKPLVEKAKQLKTITSKFTVYIDSLRARMIRESGGAYSVEEATEAGHPEYANRPKGKKDKDTPERIFVSGDYGTEKKQPEGEKLEAEVKALRQEYLDFVAKLWENGGIKATIFANQDSKKAALDALSKELTLVSSEGYHPEDHEGKTWADYTFGHMPVAAIYPLLRKFQNDAKTSESAVINFLAKQMGKMELVYDQFAVFSQSPKSYILLGETYQTEIALGAYSSQADFSVSVGGSRLSVVDGKAQYSTKPSSIGEKSYTAVISVKNPMTQETETYKQEFKYEVGQPSVNVSADKMNVFYVGVDNPVTIAAAGVPTSALKVSMTGANITKKSGTSYNVKPTRQGKAVVTIRDTKNKKSFPFEFRIKRIPDPIVKLGNQVDGLMKSGTFRAQRGLLPILEGFDFEARCNIQSYTLYYTPKRQDPIEIKGTGNSFKGRVSSSIKAAKPGDQYAFTNVKARCPGDAAARRVNGLSFKIR